MARADSGVTGLPIGGGTTKAVLADITLGTQAANQAAFTYYALPTLGKRLLISHLIITPDGSGTYDIDVRSDVEGATPVGDTYLRVAGATGKYEISIPIYVEGDVDGVVWVGVKNTSTASRTYTLTALRAEKFA